MPKKLKKTLRLAGLALCCLAILLSAGMLLRDEVLGRREREQNLRLQRQLQSAREVIPQEEEPPETDLGDGRKYAQVLPQYLDLWKENKDLWGWLTIPNTPIDYPVMFTPEEPEFYLHKGFDKEYAYSGCLFIGEGCYPTRSHVIIYGHNMENDTMFSTLPYYWSEDYYKQHKTIRFDTIVQEGTFRVMAAFYSQAYQEENEDAFRYHLYTDLSDPDTFAEYVRKAKENSLYDTGVTAEYGQRIITLSTCSYHVTDGRFAVIAVETDPAAEETEGGGGA